MSKVVFDHCSKEKSTKCEASIEISKSSLLDRKYSEEFLINQFKSQQTFLSQTFKEITDAFETKTLLKVTHEKLEFAEEKIKSLEASLNRLEHSQRNMKLQNEEFKLKAEKYSMEIENLLKENKKLKRKVDKSESENDEYYLKIEKMITEKAVCEADLSSLRENCEIFSNLRKELENVKDIYKTIVPKGIEKNGQFNSGYEIIEDES